MLRTCTLWWHMIWQLTLPRAPGVPSDVMEFIPEAFPRITLEALAVALRTSKLRLSGIRGAHLQVQLQDEDGPELLA